MKNYNLWFWLSLCTFHFALFTLLASPALAQTRTFRPGGPSPEVVSATPGGVADVATLKGLEAIFSNVAGIALALVGIALFIMLIIGGFKLMRAGGDRDKPQQAHQTLTLAFIGLVVVVSAFIILRLIKEITGVDITEFKVTQ